MSGSIQYHENKSPGSASQKSEVIGDKMKTPYKQRLETALDNVQATVFYPIKYLGPMMIAAFPATITGLSFYYHVLDTVGFHWALTVAILAGLLFEVANLFLAHIASALFNHGKIWQGVVVAILASITIYQIMQVLGESVLIVGVALLPVVHITPLITAFVYIANTFSEIIKDEREQSRIDHGFEEQRRAIELDNIRLDSQQKRAMKDDKLRLKHAETLAEIGANSTRMTPGTAPVGTDGALVIPSDTTNDTLRLSRVERLKRVAELSDGHTQSEIAEMLGCSLTTIKRDYKQMNGSLKR